MKTVADYKAAGWVEYTRKTERGYMSRKNFDEANATVWEAGGSRKGLVYYNAPNWESNRYMYRVYLTK
jgi:hypothetical protein